MKSTDGSSFPSCRALASRLFRSSHQGSRNHPGWVAALGVLACACWLAAAALPGRPERGQAGAAEADTGAGVRVAEGEYKVLTENGIGPFDPAVYDFDEVWTLFRLPDGSFEARGTRSYRSPSDESHNHEFSVHLSPGFVVLGLKEFRRLRWRPDSGPLSCDFLAAKITCTSGARDLSQSVRLDLPTHGLFGFMWPLSAFSLGSITRSASHRQKALTPVELVTLEEASRADPVLATTFSGHLKYLGQEQLSLAGRQWQADRFELKIPLHPPFILDTSPEGLLLAFAPEDAGKTVSQSGVVLVKFQQWQAF